MTGLEERIGYGFRDAKLLETALTSPACRMEHPEMRDNQRLEFLGDAVLEMLSSETVFKRFPDDDEGALTVRRTRMVSGKVLADVAERLGLRGCLRRNRGAQELPKGAKVLADAVEALIGAVWLDGGWDAAAKVFGRLGLVMDGDTAGLEDNPKGRLQELAQAMRPPRRPEYSVVKMEGAAHAPVVTVKVSVGGVGWREASAGSKAAAETAAAAALLEAMDAEGAK